MNLVFEYTVYCEFVFGPWPVTLPLLYSYCHTVLNIYIYTYWHTVLKIEYLLAYSVGHDIRYW